ncbi:putative alanine rich protein [Mycolicibacterium neworleansense]|uniref:Putative alanine rich protein n=1 Tax=Mycolicibacterium neworleansense TaxID=146018 RepID=A0A0H5RL98_9MYCO|nr:putative alanine rich protein [Mycolicibacterium neworleansense]
MLSAIAIVPATPVLVPELVGAAAAEVAGLREAVITAAGSLPPRWLAVGVGPRDEVYGPDCAGTFAGYGVDVPVALGPAGVGEPVELPLCVLVTGWIRGQAAPGATVEVHAAGPYPRRGGHRDDHRIHQLSARTFGAGGPRGTVRRMVERCPRVIGVRVARSA